jgi:PAS domain S-box-containing protein
MRESCRILLVEDDEDDYLITRDLLAAQSRVRFEVEWCDSYDEALGAVQARRHDAYLIDYRLGQRTGLDLVRDAFGTGPRAPVILLTGQDDYEIDLEASALGVADYVTKQSLDATGLERAIRYAISHNVALRDLARSQERYALAVRAAFGGIWDWDLDSDRIYLSERWLTMLGLTDPAGDYAPDRWLELVHSDDAWRLSEAIEGHLAGHSDKLEFECRMRHTDGSCLWVLCRGIAIRDSDGRPTRMAGSLADITTRKQAEIALSKSEGRWRTLLEHLQEIVVLVDQEKRITYATPSMQRWLGYGATEVVGTHLSETGHPDDHDEVSASFAEVRPGEPRLVTHRVAHRDGSWHTLQSTLICLREDPVVQAVLIASIDITEHVAIEEERERRELERRVSQRLEAVGQLASGVAHEINTPLQFVGDSVSFLKDAVNELLGLTDHYHELMWADAAIDLDERRWLIRNAEEKADLHYLSERIPAAFERTAEGVARVRSIVQAMKRFSHDSGIELAPADLNNAIKTTLEVCRNEYKYVARVELELADLPLVTCNIGEINQVLLNLIINAAQAIEEDRPSGSELGKIRICTAVQRREHIVITIADDGPGIPPELQDRIYEPFFTTKEVGKGTGQGLALARTTIDRHHGSLRCASHPGHGTTFTITLPLHAPVTTASAPQGLGHGQSDQVRGPAIETANTSLR